jgi:crossover junction endodeoxyribonuclease RuvC
LRILGVDPGSLAMGWGLLEGSPAEPVLLDCGLVRLDGRRPLAVRLARLHGEFSELVRRLEPAVAAVEAPFHGPSARSALQLAHARGVILAVLSGAGVEIAEYTPTGIKKAVTGNGGAGKEQVRDMVRRLLRQSGDWRSHDISDALAVALCHLTTAAFQDAVDRAGAKPRIPGG